MALHMKLAEALLLRSDIQKRLAQLQDRLDANAKVQEGDEPAEDVGKMLGEFEGLASQFRDLLQRINRTNLATTIDGGQTMTDALASRDVLKIRISCYRRLATAAAVQTSRTRPTEIRMVSTVKVSEMREIADRLAREMRELDTKIQAANWANDLLE